MALESSALWHWYRVFRDVSIESISLVLDKHVIDAILADGVTDSIDAAFEKKIQVRYIFASCNV